MTHTDLKRVIRDCIMDIYGKLFVRDIKIEDLDPQGYAVYLYIHGSETPTVLMSDVEDSEFKTFITQELKQLKLDRTEHFGLQKLQPTHYSQYPFC